jgi:hypothetical protein
MWKLSLLPLLSLKLKEEKKRRYKQNVSAGGEATTESLNLLGHRVRCGSDLNRQLFSFHRIAFTFFLIGPYKLGISLMGTHFFPKKPFLRMDISNG